MSWIYRFLLILQSRYSGKLIKGISTNCSRIFGFSEPRETSGLWPGRGRSRQSQMEWFTFLRWHLLHLTPVVSLTMLSVIVLAMASISSSLKSSHLCSSNSKFFIYLQIASALKLHRSCRKHPLKLIRTGQYIFLSSINSKCNNNFYNNCKSISVCQVEKRAPNI